MDRKIAEEAARWLRTLDDPSPLDRRNFAAWLRQSPGHLQEFLAVSVVSNLLSSCDWEAMRELDDAVRSSPGNVIRFPGGHAKAAPPVAAAEPSGSVKAGYWRRAIVAGACAFLAAGCFWLYHSRDVVYETSVGEQRTVQLEDGSVMSINAQSRAVVTLTKEARYVLLTGEAEFKVSHDESRPFLVKSGEVVATAIGTQFNVRSYPSGTTVSVLEGTVGVGAWKNAPATETSPDYSVVLPAGKEVHMDRSGAVRAVEDADPAGVLSWQQRLLVFRGNTLEDMIAEFNRWNHRKIRLAGRIDPERRYDGIFSASDPESLLDFLALDGSIVLEETADGIVLRPRIPTNQGRRRQPPRPNPDQTSTLSIPPAFAFAT